MGRTFNINSKISIVCETENARNGFRHRATLYLNGSPVDSATAHYINRIWESYEYQSVMQILIEATSSLSPDEKHEVLEWLKGDRTDWSGFQMTGMIAKMGDVFGKTEEEKNVWKTRMLKAGLGGRGMDIPKDFEKLPEATKSARLNEVINLISEKGKTKNKIRQKINLKKTNPLNNKFLKREITPFSQKLIPQFDTRKSFYGKAKIKSGNDGIVLQSYNKDVAKIINGKAIVKGLYSPTTTRHIKDFLKQHGIKVKSSKQIMKDYGGTW